MNIDFEDDYDHCHPEPIVFIMAGGMGKRMQSSIPKVLHHIQEKPMVVRVIQTALKLDPPPQKIVLIVGKYREMIDSTIRLHLSTETMDRIEFAIQHEALGTGHAIQTACSHLFATPKRGHIAKAPVLILSGDTPLISTETLNDMLNRIYEKDLKSPILLTIEYDDPAGYGRILRDQSTDSFHSIREEKDCDLEQRSIKEVNTGIYCVESGMLMDYIYRISPMNAQNEYYLTDIFGLMKMDGVEMECEVMDEDRAYEVYGVNTKEQLETLNTLMTIK